MKLDALVIKQNRSVGCNFYQYTSTFLFYFILFYFSENHSVINCSRESAKLSIALQSFLSKNIISFLNVRLMSTMWRDDEVVQLVISFNRHILIRVITLSALKSQASFSKFLVMILIFTRVETKSLAERRRISQYSHVFSAEFDAQP